MASIMVIQGDETKIATDNDVLIIDMGDYNCDGIAEKAQTMANLMQAMDDLELLDDDEERSWYHANLDDIMDRMIQTLP